MGYLLQYLPRVIYHAAYQHTKINVTPLSGELTLPPFQVSYLLQYGADAKLKNEDNETALDVALFKGRYSIFYERGTPVVFLMSEVPLCPKRRLDHPLFLITYPYLAHCICWVGVAHLKGDELYLRILVY